jgi:serum/glucocorticoid-regulated kinase 2
MKLTKAPSTNQMSTGKQTTVPLAGSSNAAPVEKKTARKSLGRGMLSFVGGGITEAKDERSCEADYLGIGLNEKLIKMMSKFNKENSAMTETVIFSDNMVKINKRDKPQERVLLITTKAVYNLIPGDLTKCKRRIPLALIDSVTMSEVSDEFVVHVPGEYDYRMMSLRKQEVIKALSEGYSNLVKGETLQINKTKQIVLKSVTTTRNSTKAPAATTKASGRFNLPFVGRAFGQRLSVSTPSGEDQETLSTEKGGKVTDWAHGDQESKVTPEDFNLIKVIGRGSFGKVMLVTLKGDESKIYALKVLIKEAIIARNQVEHTIAEREILEMIDHPFLMKLYWAFQTDAKLYLVMDYLRGGELFFHLKNERRFSEARSQFYAAEILMALGELHRKMIIYRDLKPENILLDNQGHLRLTDFGLSKRYQEGEQALTFCGTPEYLAPEVVMGVGHGKEVDWWSLGLLSLFIINRFFKYTRTNARINSS